MTKRRSVWVVEYRIEAKDSWRVHDDSAMAYTAKKLAQEIATTRAKLHPPTEYRVVRYDASK